MKKDAPSEGGRGRGRHAKEVPTKQEPPTPPVKKEEVILKKRLRSDVDEKPIKQLDIEPPVKQEKPIASQQQPSKKVDTKKET